MFTDIHGIKSEEKEKFLSVCESCYNCEFSEKQKEILRKWGRIAYPQLSLVIGTREAGEFVEKTSDTIRRWIQKEKVRGWRNIEGLWWVSVEDLVAML